MQRHLVGDLASYGTYHQLESAFGCVRNASRTFSDSIRQAVAKHAVTPNTSYLLMDTSHLDLSSTITDDVGIRKAVSCNSIYLALAMTVSWHRVCCCS